MSASDLYLSPNQQDLLVAALNSNQHPATQRGTKITGLSKNHQRSDSLSFTPDSTSDQTAPGSGHLDYSDDSPFLDFNADADFNDFNFDPTDQMIGDLPEDFVSTELHEKRKSIDGQDEDDEGGGKRREGDDKTAKKPGRKPLTSEPTNKRKAQNRAAQRAFRERKEQHLKDLETKVDELEKSSEAVNHENALLKAQVEKQRIELREYQKRLSWMSNGTGKPNTTAASQQQNSLGNDFHFEFPKFGDLPSTRFGNANTPQQNHNGSRKSADQKTMPRSPPQAATSRTSVSSIGSRSNSMRNSPANNTFTASPPPIQQHGTDNLSGLFSPSILQTSRNSSMGYFPETTTPSAPTRQQSTGNIYGAVPGLTSNSSNTDSPGSSSESHQHSSSNGTSPETLFNSPSSKQELSFTSFGENPQTSAVFGTQDLNNDLKINAGFDWLAQQNGGGFDPVLFNDYRETQDNILSQDFGSFFNEAYPLPELGSPEHNYDDLVINQQAPKDDLMRRVDAAKDGEETVPADKGNMLTCNKIWDRLQSMEKFRNGEIDIDNLCSELRSKAKCSEGGAVVAEKLVNKLLGV